MQIQKKTKLVQMIMFEQESPKGTRNRWGMRPMLEDFARFFFNHGKDLSGTRDYTGDFFKKHNKIEVLLSGSLKRL